MDEIEIQMNIELGTYEVDSNKVHDETNERLRAEGIDPNSPEGRAEYIKDLKVAVAKANEEFYTDVCLAFELDPACEINQEMVDDARDQEPDDLFAVLDLIAEWANT